ncbi:unnamed protein product [Schistosoma margrebowiei]|uniref:Uncharacterized protein n=1 Tax=Schistosoma margrebowiei TaxID=48269 RepID=A0A183M3Y6_9TREM|nr:unnamed protein product [Schistosoma margrebowiei]
MVVGGSQQKTLELGFMLIDTHQQNVPDLWDLPNCIQFISTMNKTDKINITFNGLCFQCDTININNQLSLNENDIQLNKSIFNKSNDSNYDYIIYLNSYHVNTHLTLNIHSIHSNTSLHYALVNYNKPISMKCFKQSPTLLLFIFNVQICNLNYIERIELKNMIKIFMNLIDITYFNHSLIGSNHDHDHDHDNNVHLILESSIIYER